jgi:hypothetical protein
MESVLYSADATLIIPPIDISDWWNAQICVKPHACPELQRSAAALFLKDHGDAIYPG